MNKKYQIILADPPWNYRDKALAGKRGAGCKYKVMDTLDIAKINVGGVTDTNCVLFMWVTMPKLNECFELIKSWGFQYKTVAFTWVKLNKVSMTPFIGMGNWTRANAEVCLLAIKGKPKRISASVSSIVMTPIERHSKKPDEVKKRIVQLMGNLPRLEMFARYKTEGWDVFGNEVDDSIKIPDF